MNGPSSDTAPGNGGGPFPSNPTTLVGRLDADGAVVTDFDDQPGPDDAIGPFLFNPTDPYDRFDDDDTVETDFDDQPGPDDAVGPAAEDADKPSGAWGKARAAASAITGDDNALLRDILSAANSEDAKARAVGRLTRGRDNAITQVRGWLDADDEGGRREPKYGRRAGVAVAALVCIPVDLTHPLYIGVQAAAAFVYVFVQGGKPERTRTITPPATTGPLALPPGVSPTEAGTNPDGMPSGAFTANLFAESPFSHAVDAAQTSSGTPYEEQARIIAEPLLRPGGLYIIDSTPDGRTAVQVGAADQQQIRLDTPTAEALHVRELVTEMETALAVSAVGLSGTKVLEVRNLGGVLQYHLEFPRGEIVAKLINKLTALASALGSTSADSLLAVADPAAANRGMLTRIIHDPLTTSPVFPMLPFGQSIHRPFVLSRTEYGTDQMLWLLRRNSGVIGANRSGKSTILARIMEFISSCDDAVFWPIDLQGSGALEIWAPCADRPVATTPAQAERYIADAVQLGAHRTAELRSRAKDLHQRRINPTQYSANWEPSRDHPQVVLVADEVSLMAKHGLMKPVASMLRTTAKAAVTAVLANHEVTEKVMGDASVRSELHNKIAARMPKKEEIERYLGDDARDNGFLADKLRLQGSLYLETVEESIAVRSRVPNLDPDGILARTDAYEPYRPHVWSGWAAAMGQGGDGDGETGEDRGTETFLDALAAVCDEQLAAGVDRMLRGDLVDAMAARDPKWRSADPSVQARIREELGIETDTHRGLTRVDPETGDAKRAHGYLLRKLIVAIEDLETTGDDNNEDVEGAGL